MHELQLIGSIVAVVGIIDIAVMGLLVVPRLKAPAKTKKILLLASTVASVSMIVGGAVMFFIGAGKS